MVKITFTTTTADVVNVLCVVVEHCLLFGVVLVLLGAVVVDQWGHYGGGSAAGLTALRRWLRVPGKDR